MNAKILIGAAALTIGALAIPSTASASDAAELMAPRHKKYESPQHFAFELRFSPYRPNIDDEPGLSGSPYTNVFGTTPRLLIGAEFDWQLLRIPYLGTLGPGFAIGYTTMSAQAKLATPRNGQTLSAEDTSLNIFPMDVVAVLRVDTFFRDAGVPIIPYAKLGPALAFWRAYSETGTSEANGVAGKGHTNGWVWAIGAMLSLNFFDNYAARNLDNTMGVNNTALFAELYSLNLTGVGQTNALYVGQTGWAFGLAFEF